MTRSEETKTLRPLPDISTFNGLKPTLVKQDAMSSSHTRMLRPNRFHGQQMGNGVDAYYVGLSNGPSAVTGYVSRETFNWLAERLGFDPLTDEERV